MISYKCIRKKNYRLSKINNNFYILKAILKSLLVFTFCLFVVIFSMWFPFIWIMCLSENETQISSDVFNHSFYSISTVLFLSYIDSKYSPKVEITDLLSESWVENWQRTVIVCHKTFSAAICFHAILTHFPRYECLLSILNGQNNEPRINIFLLNVISGTKKHINWQYTAKTVWFLLNDLCVYLT